jgi:hypothetical protein
VNRNEPFNRLYLYDDALLYEQVELHLAVQDFTLVIEGNADLTLDANCRSLMSAA